MPDFSLFDLCIKEIKGKMIEIDEIFGLNYQNMEWEAIQGAAINEVKEEKKMYGLEDFKKWMREEDNYLILAKKIIFRAENNGLFQVFAEMNEDFTKRLEDENRYQDNKEIGNKRPIFESPEAPERAPWLVEDEGSTEEIKNNKEEEEKDEDEVEETDKTETNNKPVLTKKKKNKRKGKKKH
jgi:hypothetical protein